MVLYLNFSEFKIVNFINNWKYNFNIKIDLFILFLRETNNVYYYYLFFEWNYILDVGFFKKIKTCNI